ncbi:MAG: hypothetical protein CL910_04325 [Deltaproteobacteria bacterium]|jgi:hypothetical protein|nr:hypothetical protein [Deltaproteobacteria bacterium]
MKLRWLALALGLVLLALPVTAGAKATQETPGRRLAQAMRGEEAAAQCSACLSDCGRRYGDICLSLCYSHPCWVLCNRKRAECSGECRETLACRSRRRGSCEDPSL